MAIAPQNIMTTLRGMGDAELAKYAQMHQQDPYIFPLAFQESQNRQHLRSAKQAEMAGQQQPKVVQQDLSQMAQMAAPQMPPQAAPQTQGLPEDSGIAQLPAQNLQKMAGGGIIAFEEGGYVPRYGGFTDGSVVYDPSGAVVYTDGTEQTDDDRTIMERFGIFNPENRRTLEKAERDLQARENASKNTTTTASQKQPEPTIPEVAPDEKPALAKEKGKDTPAPRPQGGLPVLASEMDSYAKAVAKLAPKEPDETNEQYMARKDKAVGPSPIEGQKERLDKQERNASGDKADALNMALIKAGLGMMAGKSQHALQNIGEGAQGGLADYNEAMKDLKKAALERDKSRDALENAAYAYKRGDFDEYEKQKEKSKDRTAQYNAHVASAMGTIKGQEVSGKYHLAAAGMPGQTERMYATLGGGDVIKGAKLLAEIQAGKRTVQQSYEDYMKAWAGKDTTMEKPLTPQQYANQIKQINAAMMPPPKPGSNPTGQVLP